MSDEPAQSDGLERGMKIAIVVYVLLLAGLVGVYIHVATLDIAHSAYITGPAKFKTLGHRNALRGFVLDAPTGRMITGAKATFELVNDDTRQEIGKARSERHGYFHAILRPLAEVPNARLAVTIESPRFDEAYEAEVELDFQSVAPLHVPPDFVSRLPRDKRDWRQHLDTEFDGELQVDAFPPNGELVRGLENTVWLRLTRKSDGAPIRGTITLDEVSGQSAEPLKRTYLTDELGFVAITFKPIGSHRWTVSARSELGEVLEEGKGELAFTTVPAQFSMQLQKHTVTPGESARGKVDTLYRSGGFMVDLYNPHHWIGAAAYGIANNQGGFEIDVPHPPLNDVGLYRIQVYESVFQPGNAWESAYVLQTTDQGTEACINALDALIDRMAVWDADTWAAWRKQVELPPTMSRARCDRWVGAILAALPRSFAAPVMIVNTQQVDRAELEAWKDDVQSILLIGVILALLIGLASILVVIFSSAAERSRQQAFMNAEMAEFDDEFESVQTTKMARLAHIMRIVIIVGTLVLFGVGVVLVLSLL